MRCCALELTASLCASQRLFGVQSSMVLLRGVPALQDELIVLWALHSYHYPIPRLNIKGLHRDTCCVHGMHEPYSNPAVVRAHFHIIERPSSFFKCTHLTIILSCTAGPALNYMDGPWVGVEPKYVTVFPHAINHGATWDIDLVARMANATGNEMRAASQIRYRTSNGQAYAAVICDSGPLANTAHHPAWGRISETYGEDPFLISRLGATVTSVMQARDRGVLKTALTTRHFMGYHHTNTMPDPTMVVTERDLYDAYLPGYKAFAIDGGAEGIMCGFASFDGVPSCANSRLLKVRALSLLQTHKFLVATHVPRTRTGSLFQFESLNRLRLLDAGNASSSHPSWLWHVKAVLRDEWKSDSIVQSDCCDSLTSIKSQHNYTDTYEEVSHRLLLALA